MMRHALWRPLLLVALWWRHFSVFGSKQPACLLPSDDKGDRQA